jgi:hypothetical protein
VVRAVLRRAAFDWDWIIRWLTREEAGRLLAAPPEHLAAMARFALETGLRRANVTGLLCRMSGLRLVRDGEVGTFSATGTK